VNKSESKAKAEADLVEARENKEAVMLELEQLSNYKAELHQSCDFVVGVRGSINGKLVLGRIGSLIVLYFRLSWQHSQEPKRKHLLL